jgi:hypothetical protein
MSRPSPGGAQNKYTNAIVDYQMENKLLLQSSDYEIIIISLKYEYDYKCSLIIILNIDLLKS